MTVVAPGATIGILGGGQLGRMLALAAARMGYRCHVYCPEAGCPAAAVSARATVADYLDEAALDAFAAAVDVVTIEFENVPAAALRHLARAVPVRPGATVLEVAQDRLLEKDAVTRAGIRTTPYARVDDRGQLDRALAEVGTPAVLKTRRLGYDGKGQAAIADPADAEAAWRASGGVPAILEAQIDFRIELSVIAARGLDGTIATYVPVENRHRDHILDVTLAPAGIPDQTAAAAVEIARRLVEALDVTGMLAVEMFLTNDGGLLVNEVAPRVHNSGHWTIEACATSQFEQNIRAVCGLPLGDPTRHSNAVMQNLIGRAAEDWAAILADPAAKLHLYGKSGIRPGRKMGHVTRLFPRHRPPRV